MDDQEAMLRRCYGERMCLRLSGRGLIAMSHEAGDDILEDLAG